jgi:hypothetical protein
LIVHFEDLDLALALFVQSGLEMFVTECRKRIINRGKYLIEIMIHCLDGGLFEQDYLPSFNMVFFV